LAITCNCVSYQLSAQTLPAFHFTEEDGLPGSRVLDVLRDDEGILWVATNNGLATYDGDKFNQIFMPSGEPFGLVHSLAKDNYGNVYAGLSNAKIAIISQGTVKTVTRSAQITTGETRKLYYSNFFKILIIGTDYGPYILRDTSLISVKIPNLKEGKSEVLAINASDSLIFITIHNYGVYKFCYNEKIPDKSNLQKIQAYGYASILNEDTLYVGWKNYILRFNTKNINTQFPRTAIDTSLFIWNFSAYKNGKFLVGGLGDDRFLGDIGFFDPISNRFSKFRIDKNIQTVNAAFYDTVSKVTWLARDNGLTAIFDSPFEYFVKDGNESILDIGLTGDSLVILSDDGINILREGEEIQILSDTEIMNAIKISYYKYHISKRMRPQVFDNDDFNLLVSLVQTNGKLFVSTQLGAISVPDLKIYLPFAVGTFKLIDHKSAYSLVKYTPLKYFPDLTDTLAWIVPKGPGGEISGVLKIIESRGTFFCLTPSNGIFALKKSIVMSSISAEKLSDKLLVDIDEDTDRNVWCISSDCELFEIGYSDSIIIKGKIGPTELGLIGASCKWMKFVDKYLYVGTNKGIFIFHRKSLFSKEPILKHFYNPYNGYTFISANSPVFDGKNKIYLHSARQIISIDTTCSASTSEDIHINNLHINGIASRFSTLQGGSLPYNQKQISFTFNQVKYPVNKNIKYRYNINSGTWIQNNQIALQSLRPGTYNIILSATNTEQNTITEKIIHFTVKPPFWNSALFLIPCSAILIFMIYIFIRIRTSQIKLRQEEKSRLIIRNSELQLRSLQNQMNPHFIFNALNAIQYFILCNDTEGSLKYLGELAKIIRSNLENASEEYISLSQEIEFLKKYVSIELMRFTDNLDIEINNHTKDPNIQIPPMLIQPLIENSIKHGIRNLKRKGIIRVDFYLTPDYLKVLVEDNGDGRLPDHNQNEQKHSGLGLKIISQRLDLLNEKYKTTINNIMFIDLKNNDMPAGTRIEITLRVNH